MLTALMVLSSTLFSTDSSVLGFVCQPKLPPCTAHDLFKKVVAYEVSLFLWQIVRHKYSKTSL